MSAPNIAQQTLAIVAKDLRREWRSKEVLITTITFAVMLMLIFTFSFFQSEKTLLLIFPGILWVSIIFSGTLALTRTFADERESGSLRALALIPGTQLSLYFGKAITNLIFMVIFEVALIPLLILAFGVDIGVAPVNFFVAVAAGTLGFVILGTLLSAMLVHNRLREVMMPLILYPLLVPLFIGGVKAVGVLYTNDAEALAKSWDWIRLMAVMDTIFAVGAPAVFRFVLDAIE